jgi:uncharacterized Fe-S cluster protein YjdI
MHLYKGKKITIYYDKEVCIHSAECINHLPSVFDVKARPWVIPDGADVEAIQKTIGLCPSGALKYDIPDDKK